MNPKTDKLGPNHGLEPGEVKLYRLLRLIVAPKKHTFMNSIACKQMFRSHKTFKQLLGLQKKGYVKLYNTKDSNANIVEVIK